MCVCRRKIRGRIAAGAQLRRGRAVLAAGMVVVVVVGVAVVTRGGAEVVAEALATGPRT